MERWIIAGSVRTGVGPLVERIGHDALAEVSRLVTGPHALIDGFRQGLPAASRRGNRDLGPQLHEYDGQPRVLAQGDLLLGREARVLDQLPQDRGGTRMRLRPGRTVQRRQHVRRQLVASRDTKRLHGPSDLFEFNRAHHLLAGGR